MIREDDFQERRKHIANLTDEELYERFWQLTEQVVEPLLELGRKNTTPSVERAVLLMGHGAGHVVYKISKEKNITIPEAGTALANGEYWTDAVALFKKGGK